MLRAQLLTGNTELDNVATGMFILIGFFKTNIFHTEKAWLAPSLVKLCPFTHAFFLDINNYFLQNTNKVRNLNSILNFIAKIFLIR